MEDDYHRSSGGPGFQNTFMDVLKLTSEKSFEHYFAKICKSYRMALVNNGGFPDRLILRGDKHFLVELKVLTLGKSGDKMLRGCYQPTQMPWHLDYLIDGGTSLYTLFKLEKKYCIIHETKEYCLAVLNGLKYKEMKERFTCEEYENLTELIRAEFKG